MDIGRFEPDPGVVPDGERTLEDLIREAGFETLAAFGEAAGLEMDEVRELCDATSDRRPTHQEIHLLAKALGRPLVDVVEALLSKESIERELAESAAALVRESFASERETMRNELESAKRECEETQRRLAAARAASEILRARIAETESRAGNLAPPEPRENRGVVFAGEEIQKARLAMCRSGCCGNYRKDHDVCVECGCFVHARAKLTTEICPLGLWLE